MTIFIDQDEAVQTFTAEYINPLPMARQFLAKLPSDPEQLSDALYKRILAAENTVAKRLRIVLEPTMVFPAPSGQVEQSKIDALNGQTFLIEPGYDYDPTMFQTDRWGFLALDYKPVIRIVDVRIIYTDAQSSLFQIPLDWVRLDRRYAHVRFVPIGNMAAVSLQASLLPILAVGRLIPNGVRIQYEAGLNDGCQEFPEITQLIYRTAIAGILKDAWVAGQRSISGDGLSQTEGLDINALLYGAAGGRPGGLEAEYTFWRDYFQGQRLMVL